jgi:hypothetical protein
MGDQFTARPLHQPLSLRWDNESPGFLQQKLPLKDFFALTETLLAISDNRWEMRRFET